MCHPHIAKTIRTKEKKLKINKQLSFLAENNIPKTFLATDDFVKNSKNSPNLTR